MLVGAFLNQLSDVHIVLEPWLFVTALGLFFIAGESIPGRVLILTS